MGFARHQQHPQPITDCIDTQRRLVVAIRQLALKRHKFEMHHGFTCMVEVDGKLHVSSHRDDMAAWCGPIDREAQLGRPLLERPQRLNPQLDHRRLSCQGKSRRPQDGQAPVPIRLPTGLQKMHRHGKRAQARGSGFKILKPPVGNDHHPRQLCQRQGRKRLIQHGHEQRALVTGRGRDHILPQIKLGGTGGLPKPAQRLCPHLGPVTKALRCAFIRQHQQNIRQRIAGFLLQFRPRQHHSQRQQRKGAQRPSQQPAPDRHGQKYHAQHREKCQPRPWQKGGKQDLQIGKRVVHCPNLCNSAGTCTWSDL